jgi:hypothetical protein
MSTTINATDSTWSVSDSEPLYHGSRTQLIDEDSLRPHKSPQFGENQTVVFATPDLWIALLCAACVSGDVLTFGHIENATASIDYVAELKPSAFDLHLRGIEAWLYTIDPRDAHRFHVSEHVGMPDHEMVSLDGKPVRLSEREHIPCLLSALRERAPSLRFVSFAEREQFARAHRVPLVRAEKRKLLHDAVAAKINALEDDQCFIVSIGGHDYSYVQWKANCKRTVDDEIVHSIKRAAREKLIANKETTYYSDEDTTDSANDDNDDADAADWTVDVMRFDRVDPRFYCFAKRQLDHDYKKSSNFRMRTGAQVKHAAQAALAAMLKK